MIPLNDPSRKFDLTRTLESDLISLIKSGPYLNGLNVASFEESFSKYVGVKYCIGVSSGTSALELALKSLRLPVGSEILMTANSGGYGSIATINSGLTPKYFDVNDSGLADIDSLKKYLTSNSKAIIVTHLYGQSVRVDNFRNFCDSNKLFLIEDCAQAAGAILDGNKIGSFGHISTFSFYPTKNLSTIGDAGCVCTEVSSIAQNIRSLREYGWKNKYFAETKGGGNYRMDEIHAMILNNQLIDLDRKNQIRREIWKKYFESLRGSGIKLLGKFDETFVAHLAVVRVKERDILAHKLSKIGIQTAIHYPVPDYQQDAFSKYFPTKLKETEQMCAEVLTLPLFPEMTEIEISKVVSALHEISNEYVGNQK